MAVIQYSALLTQLRGKLGGSQFNKGHSSYSLQRKSNPTIRQTPAQIRQRQIIGVVQREWKTEPQVRRAQAAAAAQSNPVFNRLGQQVVLSGYNHYVKIMSWRLLVNPGLAAANIAGVIITTPVNSATIELVGASFSLLSAPSSGWYEFSGSYDRLLIGQPTGSNNQTRAYMYLTRVEADGSKIYGERPFFLRFTAWGSGFIDVPSFLVPTSVYVESGFHYLLEAFTRNVGAGAQTGYWSEIITLG